MLIPATIIAIATSRSARRPLPEERIRNFGMSRPKIRENIITKMGRLPKIVETSDTGPLSIDRSASNMATGARSSLKVSRAMVVFLCFMFASCLMMCGRIEISKKMADMQKAVSQNRFQNEIETRTYLLVISAIARSKLEPKKRRNILPGKVVELEAPLLREIITAPDTTIIIASHCR